MRLPAFTTKKALLAIIVPALMIDDSQAHAKDNDDNNITLKTLQVTLNATPTEQIGEKVLNRRMLDEQNIQNAQDLVRYNTEVDVAEVGRYGNKGFAIRGVDGNRVAMNIDGISLPEVEVNEIFSPYGYMYEGRFNPDLEMMAGVRIAAGADSLVSGSGAVGGAISYRTKEPHHLVKQGHLGGYAKVSHASKNEENLATIGLAGVYDQAEFLVNYARREGHELKNHDLKKHDKQEIDNLAYIYSKDHIPNHSLKSLRYPQAANATQDSLLAKLYFHANDNHRFGLHGIYQNKDTVMNTDINASYGSRASVGPRRAKDKEQLKSYGANYRYQTLSGPIDELALHYTHAKVLGLADTWVYDRDSQNKVSFDRREYRPTNTTSDQYDLKITSTLFDLGNAGEHKFILNASKTRSDRSTSATVLKEDGSPSYLNYTFSDVKKDSHHIALIDIIRFGERLKSTLGVRYDDYQYQPYFQTDVFGYDENARVHQTCVTNNASGGFCENYRAGKSLEPTKHSQVSWGGVFDYELIQQKLTAQYKIGTGFVAPTGTQIYRNFQGLGVMEVPNYDLKAEKSLNQELALKISPTSNTQINLSGYLSKYKQFIHTKFWNDDTGGCNGRAICLQSTNLDTAEIKGMKVGIQSDLSDKLNLAGKFHVSANYHTSKDHAWVETDHDGKLKINTLAATPASLILGADYISPNGNWEIHGRLRSIRAKNPESTKGIAITPKFEMTTRECPYTGYEYYCTYDGYAKDATTGKYTKIDRVRTGYTESVETYKHANRSRNVLIYDLYGSKRFGKKDAFILNAGIYNITNVKYIPWETLRMFSNTNVNNMVDGDGHGFNRYTAPGRNYTISLTYQF
ncbi:TonB-dependent receptor domain-containing protein [Moraxella oculi]|uniref:TonB-dependent receptor domain-containing protein n=1 Tax=Moraxella oculi TaxID=2940516 RepID=A0ABW8U5R4_9GAMM